MHKVQKRTKYIFIVLMISIFAFWGCDDDSSTETPMEGEGSLVVRITDAPFPISLVAEANVTIDKIEVRASDEEEENPFVVVSEDTSMINLIHLRNGITEDFPAVEIPAGNYDLVRLYVADASIKLVDGTEFDLTVPSGAQTGIKIFIEPDLLIQNELTSELLLDFDLSKSFVVQGNPLTPAGIKGFHFKPVIRAVNNSEVGMMVGAVSDTSNALLAESEVWVEQDSVISTTFTDDNGSYALIGLNEGTYTAYATKEGYDTVAVENVQISAQTETTVNFVLTNQ